MPSVERDGASIWYEDRGEEHAGTVLLVHGGLFDPMSGDRFWVVRGIVDDLVASGYRVLVPDRRYQGGSTSAPFDALTWEVEASDLAAVLAHASVTRSHVVTGSNGYSAAIWLVLAGPDRVPSLILGWPAVPVSEALRDAFERSAIAIEEHGIETYLNRLRSRDIPRPGESRPGFPFGFALGRNSHLADQLRELAPAEVARISRATTDAILRGEALRGVTWDEAHELGRLGVRVAVVPAEPEDPYHTYTVAHSLARTIPGVRLTPGYPVPVSRFFGEARATFTRELRSLLA